MSRLQTRDVFQPDLHDFISLLPKAKQNRADQLPTAHVPVASVDSGRRNFTIAQKALPFDYPVTERQLPKYLVGFLFMSCSLEYFR